MDHLSLKFIQKEEGDKIDRIVAIGIETDDLVGRDKNKSLDLTTGENLKTDAYNLEMMVGEEVIDVKTIIIIEMIVEIEGDKTLGEASVMIEADQEKEA